MLDCLDFKFQVTFQTIKMLFEKPEYIGIYLLPWTDHQAIIQLTFHHINVRQAPIHVSRLIGQVYMTFYRQKCYSNFPRFYHFLNILKPHFMVYLIDYTCSFSIFPLFKTVKWNVPWGFAFKAGIVLKNPLTVLLQISSSKVFSCISPSCVRKVPVLSAQIDSLAFRDNSFAVAAAIAQFNLC